MDNNGQQSVVLHAFLSLQVLEYNGSTWSERKERLEKGRANHAIVEANLSSFCPAKGDLNQFGFILSYRSSRSTTITFHYLFKEINFRTFYFDWFVISSYLPGSLCPSPIPPTPGQPCTLPGELDCHYEREHDCCGNCAQNFTVSCVPDNSTTGAGLWQISSPPCPAESADCCGSEGGWLTCSSSESIHVRKVAKLWTFSVRWGGLNPIP